MDSMKLKMNAHRKYYFLATKGVKANKKDASKPNHKLVIISAANLLIIMPSVAFPL